MIAGFDTAEREGDVDLLDRFAQTHAEEAFVTLMRRHGGSVFGTALRIVRSRQLAEDVTQAVFLELAQRAGSLRRDVILAGWLHRVTRSRSIDVLRRETRRQNREQVALLLSENASRSAPSEVEELLDEAIASLGEKDRSAVMLRFFERKSLSEVGSALGVSADAAQKRVERSVEYLRRYYSRRGHPVGAVGLSAAFAVAAATTLPSRLVENVQAAVKVAISTPVRVSSFFSTLIMSVGSKIVISALVVASAAIGFLVYQTHSEAKSNIPARHLAPVSKIPAKANDRFAALGGRAAKAFVRPRLDEAGKRNLAHDPAGVLTGHDDGGYWSGADDDLLVAWAAADPQAAMTWVGAKSHSVVQAQLLGAVAAGRLLRDGPEAARRFLSEHKGDDQLRPKDQENLDTYLFMHLGREDSFDGALQMLDADKDRAGMDAGALVAGIEGSLNQVAAMDYLEAKGHPLDVDYWTFQSAFEKEPEFWSDWALQRNSGLVVDILQSWAREHPAEAGTWIEKNIPYTDARRSEIDEALKTQAPASGEGKPEENAGEEK